MITIPYDIFYILSQIKKVSVLNLYIINKYLKNSRNNTEGNFIYAFTPSLFTSCFSTIV